MNHISHVDEGQGRGNNVVSSTTADVGVAVKAKKKPPPPTEDDYSLAYGLPSAAGAYRTPE